MFKFNENDKINVEEFGCVEDRFFFLFCMGIIKNNLNLLPDDHKYYGQFDVKYFDGERGGDGFEMFSKKYPDSCFSWDLNGGALSGGIYFGNGITGIFGIGMDSTIFTIKELNDYLVNSLKSLLDEDLINDIMDEEKRKLAFAKYDM